MPRILPERLKKARAQKDVRSCPGHRAWVRKHRCSVPGCVSLLIECAHIRTGTDGGVGLKPSDCWTISLCRSHHGEQHDIGEPAFETMYGLDLIALALEFARQSPHATSLKALAD